MKHEKTFDAIEKLKEVELELHRLKNALELANKALDAKREWVGLTKKEVHDLFHPDFEVFHQRIEAKLKEKNT